MGSTSSQIRTCCQAATVVPLPPADLGQTNILDGEGEPGGLFELILTGDAAERIADEHGNSRPGDPRQRIATAVLHPIYTTNLILIGGHPGIEVLVPFARVHNAFGPDNSGTASGIGDVTVAPFLQWSDGADATGKLSIRAAVQFIAPTGKYRSSAPVNVGSGAWQVSPYVAVTKQFKHSWAISARVIYDRSGTAGTPEGRSDLNMKAGDFVVVNLSSSRQVASSWRLGVAGYVLLQTTRSRIDDVEAGGHQRVFALGPAARWQIGGVNLLAAILCETGARERPSGINFNLRLQQPF